MGEITLGVCPICNGDGYIVLHSGGSDAEGENFEPDDTERCDECYGNGVTGFDWLVIGLLNHKDYIRWEKGVKFPWEKGVKFPYYEHIGMCIRQLMADARALGIPIFCKNSITDRIAGKYADPRWAQMGIQPVQEWPTPPSGGKEQR
jgi:hypothetical protein